VVGHGRIDALAAINAIGAPTTTTTIPTGTTVPTTTTSTTLPACNPGDCDGNACTEDDACAAGVCQPGRPVTPADVGRRLRDDTAVTACAADRRKSVTKIRKPLLQAARLLDGAQRATSGNTLRRQLARARRAIRQAEKALGKERRRLSPGCAAGFATAITGGTTRLACLP
jgi:hypothetical protein